MPIIISKNGRDTKRVEGIIIKQEEKLQKYIFENLDCIPLEDIKEDVQFVCERLNIAEKMVLHLNR